MSLFDGFFSQQIVAINAKSILTIDTEGNSTIKHKSSIKKNLNKTKPKTKLNNPNKKKKQNTSVILITTTAAVPKNQETVPLLLLPNTPRIRCCRMVVT